MKKINLIIVIVLSIACLSSCGASFTNKISKKDSIALTQNTIHKIDGTYQLNFSKRINSHSKTVYTGTRKNESTVAHFILEQEIALHTFTPYVVDISIVSDTKIQFIFREEEHKNNVFATITMNMELRNDGFIHLIELEEKKRKGVPFIFESVYHKKLRIGVSHKGDLMINHFIKSIGSVFFFAAGSASDECLHYKKINTPL
ncbi:hypothetical protein IMCC3317_39130 [Kordia antarctica]|uniref:Lipoprotein n=1 Tax=Kordia antarctica TaxID=1218801 RepID=A0A7L4ZPT8_9FLAO|nr:hypothetical protein [Kordia antarctica]QHI38520.1 hypothetical protein IMCC3317_39130 [Kordia antarctica]